MQDYIAAGFDPARFWDLTPCLYAAEMEGARRRISRERELVWWGAMMPYLKRPPKFHEFVAPPLPKAKAQSVVELQAMCDALAAAWGARKVDP